MAKKKSISEQWEDATNLIGVTTASLLEVMAVSTVVGALVGLMLGGRLEPGLIATGLALISGVADNDAACREAPFNDARTALTITATEVPASSTPTAPPREIVSALAGNRWR